MSAVAPAAPIAEPEEELEREREPESPKETIVTTKTGANRVPTRSGFPEEEWVQLCQNVEGTDAFVSCEIRRKSPAGTWNAIRTIKLPARKLTELQPALEALSGGGAYIFNVNDPQTKQRLLPRWEDIYEGPARHPLQQTTILYDADSDTLKLGPQGVESFAGWTSPAVANLQSAGMPAPMAPGYGPPAPAPPMGGAAPPPFPEPQYTPTGMLMPPPEAVLPGKWLRHYPVDQQWSESRRHYAEKYGVQPGMSGDQSGLAVSMHWVNQQNREVSAAREGHARLEERHSAQTMALQQQVEAQREHAKRLEIELAHMRASREQDALRTSISNLETKLTMIAQQPPKPQLDVVGLVAALAPLASAMLTANGARASAERGEQLEMMRMMLSQQPKSNIAEMLVAVAPAITPVLVQWISNQSPAQLAELRMAQDESRMGLIKMMHDMVQASTPQDAPEPWWKPVLLGVLQEVGGVGRAMALSAANRQTSGPHALPPQPRPAGHFAPAQVNEAPAPQPAREPEQQIVTPAPASVPSDLESLLRQLSNENPQAAQHTQMILTGLVRGIQAGVPEADGRFLTYEWTVILFNLHTNLLPDQMVPLVVTHLEHLAMFNMLPAMLADVFDIEHTAAAIQRLLGALPTLDAEYAKIIIPAIIEEIETRLSPDDDDDEDGDGDSEIEDDSAPESEEVESDLAVTA